MLLAMPATSACEAVAEHSGRPGCVVTGQLSPAVWNWQLLQLAAGHGPVAVLTNICELVIAVRALSAVLRFVHGAQHAVHVR
jgi:hypothetical protein